MKRKSVGALSLRKRQKKKITTYIDSSDEDSDSDVEMDTTKPNYGDWFFNMDDLLLAHIVPYLADEYDFYIFKQINKTCNDLTNKNLMKAMEKMGKGMHGGYSLLSNWFFRRDLCCVCHSKCTQSTASTLGMYCHDRCMPQLSLYYTNENIVRTSIYPKPGVPCTYLYDTPSPCVKYIHNTCRGFNLNKSYIIYKALDKDKVDTALEDIDKFIKFTRKTERLDDIINKKATVRVGVNPVNVYQYFCTLYPNHINTMSETEISVNLSLIHMGLKDAHSALNDFYKNEIRPKLYVSRSPMVKNWPTFLRHAIPRLKNYSVTLTDLFINQELHKSTDGIKALINNNLDVINMRSINDALTDAGVQYYKTLKAVIPMLSNSCLVLRNRDIFINLATKITRGYGEAFNMYDTKAVFPQLYAVVRKSIDELTKELLVIYDKHKTRGPVFIKNSVNQLISNTF